MKKFSLLIISTIFLFSANPALAFDWSNSVFKPPMIYGVYEDDKKSHKDIIPNNNPAIPPKAEEPLLEPELEEQQIAKEPSTPSLDWLYYKEKLQKYAQGYIRDYIDDIIEIATWEPPKDPSVVTLEYWNSLTESQQKKLHYYRNEYQGDLPLRIEDLDYDEWDNYGDTATHNLAGITENIDYRGLGPRAGHQAVYDENGDLVTSQENMGTYDFISPEIDKLGHREIDVYPWIKWGNSPDDTTTEEERRKAYHQVIKDRIWDIATFNY